MAKNSQTEVAKGAEIDPATFEFYQSQAPHYTASGAQGQSRHLDGFLTRLAPGAGILELGCGGGRDAAHMKELGFDVDATDGVPAMVAKANERHDLDARVMQFGELDALSAYDAIWAHASLLHCPRKDLSGTLSRIHTALKPGGWHFANFKLGNGEGRDRFKRLYNFPTRAQLLEIYETACDWAIEEAVLYESSGFDTVDREWLAITVRKP